jgi:hypothetical protein
LLTIVWQLIPGYSLLGLFVVIALSVWSAWSIGLRVLSSHPPDSMYGLELVEESAAHEFQAAISQIRMVSPQSVDQYVPQEDHAMQEEQPDYKPSIHDPSNTSSTAFDKYHRSDDPLSSSSLPMNTTLATTLDLFTKEELLTSVVPSKSKKQGGDKSRGNVAPPHTNVSRLNHHYKQQLISPVEPNAPLLLEGQDNYRVLNAPPHDRYPVNPAPNYTTTTSSPWMFSNGESIMI